MISCALSQVNLTEIVNSTGQQEHPEPVSLYFLAKDGGILLPNEVCCEEHTFQVRARPNRVTFILVVSTISPENWVGLQVGGLEIYNSISKLSSCELHILCIGNRSVLCLMFHLIQ